MNETERWNEVCKPTLDRIDRGVAKLMEVVVTGNGKPALTARVEALERGGGADNGVRRKTVKVGPVELNGYAMSDIIKAGIAVALLACVWMLIADRSERVKAWQEIKAIRSTGATTTAQDAPGLIVAKRADTE
jgi:hypothetical protein